MVSVGGREEAIAGLGVVCVCAYMCVCVCVIHLTHHPEWAVLAACMFGAPSQDKLT